MLAFAIDTGCSIMIPIPLVPSLGKRMDVSKSRCKETGRKLKEFEKLLVVDQVLRKVLIFSVMHLYDHLLDHHGKHKFH